MYGAAVRGALYVFVMVTMMIISANIVKDCWEYFSVSLPSSLTEKRTEKFLTKLKRPKP